MTYDEKFGLSVPTKRNVSACKKSQEYGLDFLKIILAGGASAARSQIAINYVKNPVLLACVLMGANTSFTTTFHAAIHSQLESGTETGKMLAELIAVVNAKKKECLD